MKFRIRELDEPRNAGEVDCSVAGIGIEGLDDEVVPFSRQDAEGPIGGCMPMVRRLASPCISSPWIREVRAPRRRPRLAPTNGFHE
jgi:hypothetical protein